MLRSLQYFIQIAIFLAFLSTIKAQNAKFGETEVRVTIKTGSYPKEQRWTLYRLTNITSRKKETSDSCPGWIDGGDPTDWSVRYNSQHNFKCMAKDFKFQTKGTYNSNKQLSTTNHPFQVCTISTKEAPCDDDDCCSYAQDGELMGEDNFISQWYGDPGNQYGPGTNGVYDVSSKTYSYGFTLKPSSLYRIKIFDTWGDGWNGGTYRVDKMTVNGSVTVIPETEFETTTSALNGYITYSDFETNPEVDCPAGYYCPTPSQQIKCGNYTVYCPVGSYYPIKVSSNDKCGSHPAIANDYSKCYKF